MKSFKNYITEQVALVESLRSDFKDIPQDHFEKLLDIDPTTRPGKPGAYSRWLMKIYTEREYKNWMISNDLPAIEELLNDYNRAKQMNVVNKTDIMAFPTVADLRSYLEDKNISQDTLISKKDAKKNYFAKNVIESHDAKLVFENDDWAIVVPETHESSVYYGIGTGTGGEHQDAWCVSSKSNPIFFDDYTGQAPFYVIISKKHKMKPPYGSGGENQWNRYGFHEPSGNWQNAQNKKVVQKKAELEAWIDENMGEDVKDFFWNEGWQFPKRKIDILHKVGFDSPEGKKIIQKSFGDYSIVDHPENKPGTWYIWESLRLNDVLENQSDLVLGRDWDEASQQFRKCYITKYQATHKDPAGNIEELFKEIIDDKLETILKEYYEEEDYLPIMVEQDKELMKKILAYYQETDNQKYFNEIKDELVLRIEEAIGNSSRYNSDEGDYEDYSPRLSYILETTNKSMMFDNTISTEDFLDEAMDRSYIKAIMRSEDQSTAEMIVMRDDGLLHEFEPDGYFDDKLEPCDDDMVKKELKEIIIDHVNESEKINIKQYKHPDQIELDLQSFQQMLKNKLTE